MWNAAGKLVGITVGQFGNLETIGGTITQRLGLPEVVSWIEATKLRPAPVLDLKLSSTGTAMSLTWDASAIGWALQGSDNLQSWSDIGTTITAAGTYEEPIADRPRFYRLRKP